MIALIEAEGTRASPRLARANAGLAVVYHDAGRHEMAVARFESALALARRNEGLFDEAQLPLIDKFTDSLTSMQQLRGRARRAALRRADRRAQVRPQLARDRAAARDDRALVYARRRVRRCASHAATRDHARGRPGGRELGGADRSVDGAGRELSPAAAQSRGPWIRVGSEPQQRLQHHTRCGGRVHLAHAQRACGRG